VGGARGRCPVGGAPWEVPKVSPWDLRASREVQKEVPQALL